MSVNHGCQADGPTNRTLPTQLMMVAWYLLGGLVAAGVSTALAGREEEI